MTTAADIVYQHLQNMPESLVNEILDFSEYLANKYQETDKLQTRPTKRNEALFKLAGIAPGTGEPVARRHDDYLYGKKS